MEIFLSVLLYIPAIVFCVMMINVLIKAIRFGENIPERTNRTFIAGVVAGAISVLSAIIKTSISGANADSIGSIIASAFCLLFALFFKRIVAFFEDDFDRKHQISVIDDKNYLFDEKSDEFTHFDNR